TETTNRTIRVCPIPFGSSDYCVAEIDSAGYRISNFSDVITVEAYQTAPTGFAFLGRSGLDCTFGWTSITGARYAVFRKTTGSTDQFVKVAGTETTNRTIRVCPIPFGSSDYCVAEIDSAGYRISNFSDVITVEAYQTAPTDFNQNGRSGSTITFGWTSVSGTRYAIYRSVTGSNEIPSKVSGTDTSSNNITLITPAGNYDYYLAIVDESGFRTSGFSSPVTVIQ
ncbi:MAG TPA: peptidase M4, partial [Clostridia bacterium]